MKWLDEWSRSLPTMSAVDDAPNLDHPPRGCEGGSRCPVRGCGRPGLHLAVCAGPRPGVRSIIEVELCCAHAREVFGGAACSEIDAQVEGGDDAEA